jgi:hypothetical protein
MLQGRNLEAPPGERRSFWARQYGPQVSPGQVVFDLFGGVLLPLACLWFDPIVFQSGGLGEAMLVKVKVAAYSFVAIEIVTLLVWLFVGQHVGRFAGLQAGTLFAGAAGSALLGIVLLPLSLIGLMAVIGVLGFSPFLVAWIYLRNSRRAVQVASRSTESGTRLSAWIGGLVVVIASIAAQAVVVQQTSRLLSVAIDGNETASEQALETLSQWHWAVRPLADMDRLVREFYRETNQSRRNRIATVYETVAKENIENRLAAMND